MTVKELYEALEARIPRALSCKWDNDGLMCCPDPAAEVKRVLIALDVTAEIAERAVAEGYDLILSHHPLVFRPLKAIEPSNHVAKKVIRLLTSGVTVMSFHTRLDAVCGGVNDTLAAALGLADVVPFGEGDECLGRVGDLAKAMTLEEFAALVKQATGAPSVTVSDAGLPVRRVALLGGSGSDDVPLVDLTGADTYLTGELAHHHLTDSPERGINLVAAGHFYTENPVCQTMQSMLLDIDPALTVTVADSNRIRVI